MKKTLTIILLLICTHTLLFSQSIDKKSFRIEKRYIHPKSKYLAFSAGWGFATQFLNDPNEFLTTGLQFYNQRLPHVMYEHGISNNFFAETGYSYAWQGVFYAREVNGSGGMSSYSGLYHTHDFHLGGGYRFIVKNNFHIINFHAGFFMGFADHTERFADLPLSFGRNHLDFITNFKYEVNVNLNNFSKVSFGPYLGISKEFRLSKDIRFFAKYIQRFGLNTIMSGDIVLTSDEIDFVDEPATFIIRGGGAFVTFGLKILLFRNRLN